MIKKAFSLRRIISNCVGHFVSWRSDLACCIMKKEESGRLVWFTLFNDFLLGGLKREKRNCVMC